MHVEITDCPLSPERLLAEAELVFDAEDGPLAGLKLVGFSLWCGANTDVFVTFPSRAFGVGNERRFFDYLRGDQDAATRLKRLIVDAFNAHRAAADTRDAAGEPRRTWHLAEPRPPPDAPPPTPKASRTRQSRR